MLAAGSDESDSESESEENGVIGASCSSDNSATESKNNAGVTNGSITDDTEDEDEEKEETIPVTNGALEPEVDPKKVSVLLLGQTNSREETKWLTKLSAGCCIYFRYSFYHFP